MKMYDQWIDLVNLRCEEYAENIRIPTSMKFGTAEEDDALRRDLTINSVFYNINNGSVEDLTGKGVEDLKSGIIATPLPPKATFLDDPLRVLRAVRFGFTLDEDLKKAASSKEVLKALSKKIRRERIGNEIDSMIYGSGPVTAIACLSQLKLFNIVFALPLSSSDKEPTPSGNRSSLCQAYSEAMWKLLESPRLGTTFSREQRRFALYAALFLPFQNTVYKYKNDNSVSVVNHIVKFSMKRNTTDAATIINIHRTTDRFLSLIRAIQLKDEVQIDLPFEVPPSSKIRIFAGTLLRDIKDWRLSLLTSLLLLDQEIGGQLDFQVDKILEIYLTVEETILELGLENVWDVKPLVNGNEIIEIAELKQGGSLIREWLQEVMTWQLAYPSGSAEECKNWIREEIKGKRPRTE